jgi:hypothetical protein
MTTIYRTDKQGTPWTYLPDCNTIAIFGGRAGNGYSVRLPGEKSKTVPFSALMDPANCEGGLERWPQLKK